jgi:hypothetical protein
MFCRLINEELSYHAFSYKEDLRRKSSPTTPTDSTTSSTQQKQYNDDISLADKCILYHAKAYFVDIAQQKEVIPTSSRITIEDDMKDIANRAQLHDESTSERELNPLQSWETPQHTSHHHHEHVNKDTMNLTADEIPLQPTAICVELVGNRFLRRMVRKIVVS